MQGNSSNKNGNEVIPVASHPYAREYNMNHKNRGKACIFHHYEYLDEKIETREGNSVDVDRLYEELNELDFEVQLYKDLKAEKIKKTLEKVAKDDHTDSDCLMVFVLSHGNQKEEDTDEGEEGKGGKPKKRKRALFTTTKKQTVFAFDKEYDEVDLFQPFIGSNAKTLRGKPKLFFIQACRGTEKQKKSKVKYESTRCQTDGPSDNGTFELYWVPDTADFLIACSTFNGTASLRKDQGTLFIQTLCDVLRINRERGSLDDLNTMLSFVNGRVAPFGQMPFVTSTLTKLVYFRPKPNPNPRICENMGNDQGDSDEE